MKSLVQNQKLWAEKQVVFNRLHLHSFCSFTCEMTRRAALLELCDWLFLAFNVPSSSAVAASQYQTLLSQLLKTWGHFKAVVSLLKSTVDSSIDSAFIRLLLLGFFILCPLISSSSFLSFPFLLLPWETMSCFSHCTYSEWLNVYLI